MVFIVTALSRNLTKRLVENLGAGRHGDGNGLYLVVDPSGARRWIVRVTVKGQKNRKGARLRTDFGLGGAIRRSLQFGSARPERRILLKNSSCFEGHRLIQFPYKARG